MPHLPARSVGIILSFAPLFVHRSWRHAQALLIGAILCPGQRTVASVLRITCRARDRHFVNTHRVVSRAAWSPRTGARILLRLLVEAFAPRGPRAELPSDVEQRHVPPVRDRRSDGTSASLAAAGDDTLQPYCGRGAEHDPPRVFRRVQQDRRRKPQHCDRGGRNATGHARLIYAHGEACEEARLRGWDEGDGTHL